MSAKKVLAPIAIVAVAVIAPELIPELGQTIAGAVGAGTVSAATATAIGSAAISGGLSLAEGDSVSQSLRNAVIAGAGGAVGGYVGGGTLGAAASGATSTALHGGNAADVLRGAVLSAGTSLAVQGLNQAYMASQANLTAPTGATFGQGGAVDQTSGEGGLNANRVPTGGNDSLTVRSNALFQGYGTPTYENLGVGGTMQPAYASGTSYLGSPDLTAGFGTRDRASDVQSRVGGPQPLSQGVQSGLSKIIGQGLGALYPASSTQSIGRGGQLPAASPAGVITGTTQGLGGLRSPGDLGTEATGKPRQNVWNEQSLKLRDALGV